MKKPVLSMRTFTLLGTFVACSAMVPDKAFAAPDTEAFHAYGTNTANAAPEVLEVSPSRSSRTLLQQRQHVSYGQLWALYRKLFPAPPTPTSPTPEKIRIVKKLYGCHDDDDDARFCVLLNDRLFLALDEFDFKVGRDYDADDD